MDLSRRGFLASNAAFGVASATIGTGMQQTQPHLTFDPHDANLHFDLVIRGARVVDPSQGLDARRDIGIKNGQIAALAPEIDAARATQQIDASGLCASPGLVDLHCHYFHQVSGIGLPADEMMTMTGTTTGVDAGDAGYSSFSGFRHFVIGAARTRLFAFVHISSIGLVGDPIRVGEMLNIDNAQIEPCARAVAENRDIVLGVKVRMSHNVVGTNGIEPLRRAIAAAELAGGGARVMCHIGDTPVPMREILALMRPGDIVTHCYSGAGTNNIVVDGTLIPEALGARRRGVLFDVAHGGGSFNYGVAEHAIASGLHPTTISSDVHGVSVNTPGKPLLPWVLSKFLNMGFSLSDVLALATVEPAKIIDRVPALGTLMIGAPADVWIFRIVDGPVDFVDTQQNHRTGTRYLESVKVVRDGRPQGFPFPQPFTYT